MRRSVRALAPGVVVLATSSGAACGLDVVGVAATVAADAGGPEPGGPSSPLPDGAPGDDNDGEAIDADAAADAPIDAGPTCVKTALLLVDQDPKAESGASSVLTNAGFAVSAVADYSKYEGDPSPAGFGVVMLLSGKNYLEMPTAGQDAIVKALAQGTGFVTEEWSGYNIQNDDFQVLAPYILFDYEEYEEEDPVTLSATDAAHPLWAGLPASFTTAKKIAVGRGTPRAGAASIAQASIQGGVVAPGLLHLDNGTTRVAETALAPSYVNEDALNDDANVRTLFGNMALWAARCR